MRWVCSEEAVGLVLHGDVSERPIPELGRGGGEVRSCPAWGGSGYAQSRMSCIFTGGQTKNRSLQDQAAGAGVFGAVVLDLNASAQPRTCSGYERTCIPRGLCECHLSALGACNYS